MFFIMSSGKGACLSPVEGYFLVHGHHSSHKDTEFVFVCASSLYAFLLLLIILQVSHKISYLCIIQFEVASLLEDEKITDLVLLSFAT